MDFHSRLPSSLNSQRNLETVRKIKARLETEELGGILIVGVEKLIGGKRVGSEEL